MKRLLGKIWLTAGLPLVVIIAVSITYVNGGCDRETVDLTMISFGGLGFITSILRLTNIL